MKNGSIALLIFIIFIGLVLLTLRVLNAKRKSAFLSDRSPADVNELVELCFPDLRQEEALFYWHELAKALRVDPELMRPEDLVSEHIPKHLPELDVDELDRFLGENNVQQGAVRLDMSVKDLIRVLASSSSRQR